MAKYLKCLGLLLLSIIICGGVLACQPNDGTVVDGKDCDIVTAYNSSQLSAEDISNVSYYLYGYVKEIVDDDVKNVHKVDFTPTVDLPLLDQKTEAILKTIYYNNHRSIFTQNNGTIDDIQIVKYLGKYNDCYVLEMEVSFLHSLTTITPYSVGNLRFVDGGTGEFIRVFYEVDY